MTSDVRKALTAIDCIYDDLVEVANEIFNTTTKEVDGMMTDAYNDIEKMSNDAIRDLMLKLSLKSYTFSEVKEKSAFKSTMGEILRKEAYAKNFNSIEGTVAVRETNATIQTSGEIIAEEIYTLVANMLKTKLDEIHRVVNTLQTVLMTRIQEAKLTTVG